MTAYIHEGTISAYQSIILHVRGVRYIQTTGTMCRESFFCFLSFTKDIRRSIIVNLKKKKARPKMTAGLSFNVKSIRDY